MLHYGQVLSSVGGLLLVGVGLVVSFGLVQALLSSAAGSLSRMLATIPVLGGIYIRLSPRSWSLDRTLVFAKVPSAAMWFSGIAFVVGVVVWMLFDESTSFYQFAFVWGWMTDVNVAFSVGVDGLSIFFLLLNVLLTPLCVMASWKGIEQEQKVYYGLFLVLEGFVNLVFRATDLLTFYLFFEAVLIPMFYIIGMWGSRERKVRAAYFFFRYTLVGSVFMLLARLLMYSVSGTRDIQSLSMTVSDTFGFTWLMWMWVAFFASFAVKVPMLPVHIWLPEAHVEAPTAGSVILAGILLKLGTYGMMRRLLGLFPLASVYFIPHVFMLSLRAIIYTSRTAIRQSDMKRIIAYASVAHMNTTLVGLFSLTQQGVDGALLQMLSHGLVSGALFMCVGVLYDQHHTRMVSYYGGVAQMMPVFTMLFLFFTMANIALPGTSSFVGEFMIFMGVFQVNTFVGVMSATGMVLGGAYSLWLFNRVAYGNPKLTFVGNSVDVSPREFYSFLPLVVLTLVLGVLPGFVLDGISVSTATLIGRVTSMGSV